MLFAFDAAGQQGCAGIPVVCSPLWSAPLATRRGLRLVPSAPAVWDGKVFVPGKFDFTVHVFDAAGQEGCSGSPTVCSELWSAAVPPFGCAASSCEISGPAHLERCALCDWGGTRRIRRSVRVRRNGAVVWRNAEGVRTPMARSSPAPRSSHPRSAKGVVYTVDYEEGFLEGPALRAFDASGVQGCSGAPKVCEPLWTSTTRGLTSAPMVANGVVFATSVSDLSCEIDCTGIAHVLAFDGAGIQGCSGIPRQCAPIHDVVRPRDYSLLGEPVVANGVLYVGELDINYGTGRINRVLALTP